MSGAYQAEPPAPDPLVPVAAADRVDIRGRRVIVGQAGLGWRADLRADSPVEQRGRVYVPVLTEHDWYRAEAEQVEVFAPLVAIERVWVEWHGQPTSRPTGAAPPVRHPVPVAEDRHVTGRRIVHLGPQSGRVSRDLRAVSEPHAEPDGSAVLLVVTELDWYRWTWTGRTPRAMSVAADQVWTE